MSPSFAAGSKRYQSLPSAASSVVAWAEDPRPEEGTGLKEIDELQEVRGWPQNPCFEDMVSCEQTPLQGSCGGWWKLDSALRVQLDQQRPSVAPERCAGQSAVLRITTRLLLDNMGRLWQQPLRSCWLPSW